MKITHTLEQPLSRDVSAEFFPSLFLASNHGSYLALSADPTKNVSNYYGLFVSKTGDKNHVIKNAYNNDQYVLYKTINSVYLVDTNGAMRIPREVRCTPDVCTRIYEDEDVDVQESYTLTQHGMICTIRGEARMRITLDFREIFDTNDKGRIYNIYREEDHIVVEYCKYTDHTLTTPKEKKYLLICGIDDFSIDNQWYAQDYAYDALRNASTRFYVYGGIVCTVKNQSIRCAFGHDKLDALKNLHKLQQYIAPDEEREENQHEEYGKLVAGTFSSMSADRSHAYVYAANQLQHMLMNFLHDNRFNGLWAGLPWFFQHWSRDELVSIGGLIAQKDYTVAKELLFKHLNYIGSDGRLPNIYPTASLQSADSIGWLFMRIHHLLLTLEQQGTLHKYFTMFELTFIHERLGYSLKKLHTHHYTGGLIHNDPLTTWMDTHAADGSDGRGGFRIEIQSLFLAQLALNSYLEDLLSNKYIKKQEKLVNANPPSKSLPEFATFVKQRFVSVRLGKTILNDGYACEYADVARPNVFIAYYAYPRLLSSDEWSDVFDEAIAKLWCEWTSDGTSDGTLPNDDVLGGLSTIDKSHRLYQPNYTGQDNKSYHRGDSWFYINNIAAICMHRLNKEKYAHYINAIIASGAHDILWNGFLGASSELTSSSHLHAGGTFCQTWSMATYVELIKEVYEKS